jgi:hypothetical protein
VVAASKNVAAAEQSVLTVIGLSFANGVHAMGENFRCVHRWK